MSRHHRRDPARYRDEEEGEDEDRYYRQRQERYYHEDEVEPPARRHRHQDYDSHRYRHDYDEERSEVERAPSDRAVSEFILDNPRYDPYESERRSPHGRGSAERGAGAGTARSPPEEHEASEIYAQAHRAAPVSELSHYAPSQHTHKSTHSDNTVKTKTSRHGNLMIETMAAPHPCCPNTKGVCCLMLLLNLAIILISLGFVIILQLFRPPFVWYIGLALLIVGFFALIFCLIYCVWVCRDAHRLNDQGELYWTHHWQKQWGYQPSEKPAEPYRQRY